MPNRILILILPSSSSIPLSARYAHLDLSRSDSLIRLLSALLALPMERPCSQYASCLCNISANNLRVVRPADIIHQHSGDYFVCAIRQFERAKLHLEETADVCVYLCLCFSCACDRNSNESPECLFDWSVPVRLAKLLTVGTNHSCRLSSVIIRLRVVIVAISTAGHATANANRPSIRLTLLAGPAASFTCTSINQGFRSLS